MFNWFKKKTLASHLRDTKKIKINGVMFEIKKIDVMNHLEGSKVMVQMFQTYEEKRISDKTPKNDDLNMKRIKSHMTDIILAGTVKPRLSRKIEPGKIEVEEVFKDWDMSEELYNQILMFTHGKKKLLNTPQRF